MKIRETLIKDKIISQEDLDFIISTTPAILWKLELEATDDNIVDVIDSMQDYSVAMLGDGNNASDIAKRYDSLVFDISVM